MTTRRRRDERSGGAPAGQAERSGREDAPRDAADPREDEGYGQPESSAQKAPPSRREDPPGHPE